MSQASRWSTLRVVTGVILVTIALLKLVPSGSAKYTPPPLWASIVIGVLGTMEFVAGVLLLTRRFVAGTSIAIAIGAALLGGVALVGGPSLGANSSCGCLGPLRVSHYERVMLAAGLAFLGALNVLGTTYGVERSART